MTRVKVTLKVDRLTRTAIFIASAWRGRRRLQGRGKTRAEAVGRLRRMIEQHQALDELERGYPEEMEMEW